MSVGLKSVWVQILKWDSSVFQWFLFLVSHTLRITTWFCVHWPMKVSWWTPAALWNESLRGGLHATVCDSRAANCIGSAWVMFLHSFLHVNQSDNVFGLTHPLSPPPTLPARSRNSDRSSFDKETKIRLSKCRCLRSSDTHANMH